MLKGKKREIKDANKETKGIGELKVRSETLFALRNYVKDTNEKIQNI